MVWLLVGVVLQEGQLVGRLGGGSGLAGFFGDVSGDSVENFVSNVLDGFVWRL